MKTSFARIVIWKALLLAVVGTVCYGAVSTYNYVSDRQIEACRQKISHAPEIDFEPFDEDGNLTIPEQSQLDELERLQPERLRADIKELASGRKQPPAYSEAFYGDGWQGQVNRYRNTQELLSVAAAISLAAALLGLVAVCLCAVKMLISRSLQARKQHKVFIEKLSISAEAESGESDADQDQPEDDKRPDSDANFGSSDLSDEAGHDQLYQSLGKGLGDLGQFSGRFSRQPLDIPTVATLMSTEPVNKSLAELSQEISAIREYASQQQDRVKKLQDGYDWGIIKRFCVRIIRCIDNIELQIDELIEQCVDVQFLEDIRDELLFAFESSGVEKFEPEVNSDYEGMEKFVEAVAHRVHTDDGNMAGKVADIVRCGYQYVVNEDDVKIVRSAQVRLYG